MQYCIMLTIKAVKDGQEVPILELDGPLPAHPGKYGPGWHLYRYTVAEYGLPAYSGEIHANEDEGVVGIVFRVHKDLKRK